VPPFNLIKVEHYRPALDSGFIECIAEINNIVNNPDAPTFENTILALEFSGKLLERVYEVFYNINMSDGCEEMKKIQTDYAPRFTAHRDEIFMNEKLFARVKEVYDNRHSQGLDHDDIQLIQYYYKNFVRGGTNLPPDKKDELKQINDKISKLTTQFGMKLLAENNKFRVIVDNETDLAGLPPTSISAAAELATKNGYEGK
jgi:peptidyl-dipeptidase Dcp